MTGLIIPSGGRDAAALRVGFGFHAIDCRREEAFDTIPVRRGYRLAYEFSVDILPLYCVSFTARPTIRVYRLSARRIRHLADDDSAIRRFPESIFNTMMIPPTFSRFHRDDKKPPPADFAATHHDAHFEDFEIPTFECTLPSPSSGRPPFSTATRCSSSFRQNWRYFAHDTFFTFTPISSMCG